MASVDYELILEKIPTSDKDLARVKSLLLLELQFSVEEALSILSSIPIVIATSEDETRLESVAAQFLEAGAEVSIKKKLLRSDDQTLDIIDEIEFPEDEPFHHDVTDQDVNVIDLALEENLEDILRQFEEQESAPPLKEDQDRDIFIVDDVSSMEFMDFGVGELSEESSDSSDENPDPKSQLSAPFLFELVDDSDHALNTSGEHSAPVDPATGNQEEEVQTKLSSGLTFELEESVQSKYFESQEHSGDESSSDFSEPETVPPELPDLELVDLKNGLALDGSPQTDILISSSHHSSNLQLSEVSEAAKGGVNDQDNYELFQGTKTDPASDNKGVEGFLKRRERAVVVENKTSEMVKQEQGKPILVYILVAAVLFFGILNVLNMLNDLGDDYVFEPVSNQTTKTTKVKNDASKKPEIKESAILSLINEQGHLSLEIKQLNKTAFFVSLLLKDFPKVDLKSPVIRPEMLDVSWIDSLRASSIVEGDIRKGFSIPGRLVLRDARALQRFESRTEVVFEEFAIVTTITYGNQTDTRSFDLDQKALMILQELFKGVAN